ncbi:MAG: ATP-binding protein [Ferruginibacter sp.]
MDKRFKQIIFQLSEYSSGRFDKTFPLSPQLDDVDAIISGINMLGEELKAITISRDYFTNIFNSISDMVFILNNKGVIEEVNRSAEQQLKFERGDLKGKFIKVVLKDNHFSCRKIIKELNNNPFPVSGETNFYTSEGLMIPVKINASFFKTERRRPQLILLTAADISFQLKTENLIIRTIINTQEKERQRLAKDLHDSLTQQLSAIKFYIITTAEMITRQQQKMILLKSNEALATLITDMRNICFNLMPKTLEEFGLVKAVKELCNHSYYKQKAFINIRQNTPLPDFIPELKIDLYRVIQEFMTNAFKHGESSKIDIIFTYRKKNLKIHLSDNGKGFDIRQPANGMGLQNVRSRVKLHNGQLKLGSSIGQGTYYTITIPVNS